MLRYKIVFIFVIGVVIGCFCSACSCSNEGKESSKGRKAINWNALYRVQNLMEEYPDSAYALLQRINPDKLEDEEELARYNLLMTIAADRKYMTQEDFKAIQPAIHDYLENTQHAARKDKALWLSIGCITTFLLVCCFFYYQWADNENSRLRLKQRVLQKENLLMELTKKADALEIERQRLALENMTLEKSQLEQEKEHLTVLLEQQELQAQKPQSNQQTQQNQLPEAVQQAMRQRLEMLNSLLAKEITENSAYAEPYRKWIETIHNDRNQFMDSTRLAFTATHPKLIRYLQDHGLTRDEVNYLCLYAIGLRGKEVGEYIRLKRHYNISSTIRRKLGLDEHQTNLGKYIQRLLSEF